MMKNKVLKTAAAALALVLMTGTVIPVQAADTASGERKNMVTMEKQSLGLGSIENARQLGGYETRDGRHVKENLLLRTAKLSTASGADQKALTDIYHLGYVVDFRTTEEIADAPDPEMDGVVNRQIRILDETGGSSSNASIAGIYGSTSANPASSLLGLVQSGYVSETMYVDVAFSETAQKGYRAFFQVLLDNSEGKAVLWHCTGGKDRAGTAAVLLLSALGVDRETILDDFALTNEFNRDKIAYMGKMAGELTSSAEDINGVMYLTGVNRNYMELMLDAIDEAYGSIEGYLVNAIGLSPADFTQLQAMYLE